MVTGREMFCQSPAIRAAMKIADNNSEIRQGLATGRFGGGILT